MDDVTAITFLLGLAIPFGWEAVTERGWRRYGAGALAASFALTALLWSPLKTNLPSLAGTITTLAQAPEAWFALFIFCAAIAMFTGPQFRRATGEPVQQGQTKAFAERIAALSLQVATQAERLGEVREANDARQGDHEIDSDLACLLSFGRGQADVAALNELIEDAPIFTVPRDGSRDHMDDCFSQIHTFVQRALIQFGQGDQSTTIQARLRNAEQNADHQLQLLLQEQPNLSANVTRIRKALVVENQKDNLLSFLKYRRHELLSEIRAKRGTLTQRTKSRNAG